MEFPTEQQVCLYLEDLDPKKAAGIDNIGAHDLKGGKPVIVKHLCNIVNTSIECGTFPKPQKEAKVTPLHKGGSKENMDNYRPISVLPTASKILEHHVHKYLNNYFCDNNCTVCTSQNRKYLNMNNFQLHLYNTILPIVFHVKSLGLCIDNNLT